MLILFLFVFLISGDITLIFRGYTVYLILRHIKIVERQSLIYLS